MQKISSYLYPNRINVVADLALFPTRWNIVYQNKIKIYQGVDNVLTIDVKNADQKRIDIDEMDIRMIITDTAGKLVSDVEVAATQTLGLATATVSAADLEFVSPQFLNFSIYRINEDETKTVLYADTQFGAKGNMELMGTILAKETPVREITTFTVITRDTVVPFVPRYFSDAVEIKQPNFLINPEDDEITLDFIFKNLDGEVTVQFTKDTVISSSIDWTTIESFTVSQSTATTTKVYAYPTYNREWAWARVYYIPNTNTTGSIDKVLVRL
jgi:hypothetical protein